MQHGTGASGFAVTTAGATHVARQPSGWEPGWEARYFCAAPDCPEPYSYWWTGIRPEGEPCPGCGRTGGSTLTLGSQPLVVS